MGGSSNSASGIVSSSYRINTTSAMQVEQMCSRCGSQSHRAAECCKPFLAVSCAYCGKSGHSKASCQKAAFDERRRRRAADKAAFEERERRRAADKAAFEERQQR